jgi:predicted O-linked N-acetylglucosamine transferase (SPINDLY family)
MDLAAEAFHEGTRLAQAGRLEEAIVALARAVALRPDLAEAHFNLGSAYRDVGNRTAAAEAYRSALELRPAWSDAELGLGVVLRELGRLDEAVVHLKRAVAAQRDSADAHQELGNACTAMGDWREALEHFRRAAALRPDDARPRWALAMAQIPALEVAGVDVGERRAAFDKELAALEQWLAARHRTEDAQAVSTHPPFFLAYQELPNREPLARYGRLCAGLMERWQQSAGVAPPRRRGSGRIRVGVVSAHVYNHSVWTALTRGWVERLARRRLFGRRYELHVFHVGSREDAETAFARQHAARLHRGERSLADWARLIQQAALDVLVYPEVGMDATSAKLAAMRLAPSQAASWGHPETTGLPTIDHFISAAALEPPAAEANYTEQLERLPGLGCWLRRAEQPISPSAHGIEGRPLLVCAGTPFKYTARHDRVLAAIAARLPGCRLVFFRGEPAALSRKLEARLRHAFGAARLDFERQVKFVPWLDLQRFRELLAHADLYLDTLGFSGFNTALLALESGVPVLAYEGRYLRGRLASGMLRHLGLDELVARTEGEYIELAVALASDDGRRAALRQRIARERGRLYEDPTPVAALEAFFERIARP